MLQSPRGLAGEPDVAVSTAKLQEDGSRGSHLSFQSGRFSDKALATDKSLVACLGGMLVKKAFEGGRLEKKTLSCASSILAGGLLLASTSSVLVEEPLAVGSLLLAGASGLLDEESVLVRSRWRRAASSWRAQAACLTRSDSY